MPPKNLYDEKYFKHKKWTPAEEEKDWPATLELLNPEQGDKILDVACGLGRFSKAIAEQGAEVIGIDISGYAIEQAKERCKGMKNIKFITMDALSMNWENHFDKVFWHHGPEHFPLLDVRKVLKKIYHALRDEGVLIIGLPINDLRFYRRAMRFVAARPTISDITHIINFSPSKIKKEITSAGFFIDKVCPFFYFVIRLPRICFTIPLLKELFIASAEIRAIKR